MITFASNQCKNAMQLANSATFLACGVSDRVCKYLNFIGLSSSRETAHSAMHNLSSKAQQEVIKRQKINPRLPTNLGPLICVDNLDFSQSVHVKSIDNQNTMFHGTWGYLHTINHDILASIDPKDLSLESYKRAISESANEIMSPAIFVITKDESYHQRLIYKSQIALVFMTYIAQASDQTPKIALVPPPIEVLAAQKPDITMLKLMVASDNSSEGVGEVFEGLIRQSGLTEEQFASRLTVIEGDLGTCLNLNSLRAQQKPDEFPDESMSNFFTLLGGAHILWNFTQSIITLHFGYSSDSRDVGCWHLLEALGVKSNQILNKKDFSLMLAQITKVHEATVAYLILYVISL